MINVSCSRTQLSDAGEARNRGLLISSQALALPLPVYIATALPLPVYRRENFVRSHQAWTQTTNVVVDFLFIVTPIVEVCSCSMCCCTLLYVHSSIAIILMGKRELIALLNLSSWCLVMVVRLFLAVPRGCLRYVIVVFPDHTHLLFLIYYWVRATSERRTCADTEGNMGSAENHNFDRLLRKLAFGRPPPPLEKSWTPFPHPVKCLTTSGTLENYCFPKNKTSDPSVKLLNKLKVRTKNSKSNKTTLSELFTVRWAWTLYPHLIRNSWIRACRRHIIPH